MKHVLHRRAQHKFQKYLTGNNGLLTPLWGPERWLADAPHLQLVEWCASYRPVWPPQSDLGYSPPSRCFQRSSLQPDPQEQLIHTGSPRQNLSVLLCEIKMKERERNRDNICTGIYIFFLPNYWLIVKKSILQIVACHFLCV